MAEREITFELTTASGVELQVHEFSARERLSGGFAMRVTAVGSTAPDVDALIGTRASLAVLRGDGNARRFHGVVRDAAVESPHPGTFRVHLEVVARVELLKLGRECRIFQDRSVPDIVRAVLDDAGLSGEAQSWSVTASYDPQPYITQYNESDWEFVQRLLDREGVGFLVRHGEREEQVVFFDDEHAWQPAEGATATLVDRDATQLSEDVVWSVRDARRGASDAVALRDYDCTRPSFDLTTRATAPNGGTREVYHHPGGFSDTGPGERRARRRLERLRVGARTVTAWSDCAFLEPGRTFSIAQSPRASIDGEYVSWSCEHRGLIARDGRPTLYECRFSALPREVPFRPDVDVVAPVPGVMVAFVTTASGEEIHPDEWGRVKARFPWDRSGLTDARSSTWMRVGQLALGGSMILPRGGYEVLVDAELDDLDRPLVTAHLYNGEATVPYALPGNATRSSIQSATYQGGPGSNELRFEDSGGAEEIFLNASRDLTLSVDHDTSWRVTNNESVRVGSNRSLRVGSNRQRSVTSNRTLNVDGNLSVNVTGVHSETVGGDESLTIGGTRHGKVGGDLSERTTGTLSRRVASLQAVTGLAGVTRKVAANLTNNVGGAWIQMSGGSVASSCNGGRTELIGALKFIKAKTMSVECGAAYTENVATMSVKAGGSRADDAVGAITISAGGGLSVEANVINIEAKNRLLVTAGGCVIQLSSGGDVKVRAATIDLRGVEGIRQVTHNSN